jgi:AraC-like DNA-binding protein/ActR/RegA family two-component response regulator
VLIVDDEPFFRSALRALLPWEAHGWAVAGEAIDGAEALAFLRREPVDAVFTDIRMPVMDGVELIRRARDEGIKAAFVVLSAYDEFGLVKGAFLEGARDYVLKPELSAERVLAALARVCGLTGASAAPLEATGTGRVCLACFETDGDAAGRLLETIRGQAAARGGEVLPLAEPGRVAVALRFDDARPLGEVLAEVEAFAVDVVEKARNACGATVGCGLSTVVAGPVDLGTLAAEADRACAYGFLRGRGKVIHAARVPAAPRPPVARVTPDRDGPSRLAALLARRDADGLRDALPGLLPSDPRFTVEDIPTVRSHYAACLAALDEFAASAPALDTAPVRALSARVRERLSGSADVPELNVLLREALGAAVSAAGGAGRLLRGALALVHDDPGAPLSLAAAARRLGVTPAYLSRVFSREMGVSFTAYLAAARMRLAARLLGSSTLKVHEVAERVGYASAEHFSRTFRRVMGTSPRAWVERGGGGG